MEALETNALKRMTKESFMMRKTWIAGLALALATASPAVAARHGSDHHSTSEWGNCDSGGSFSTATLSGTYEFEGTGFADDGAPGQVSILGTLTFDGTSVVSGNLIFTRADKTQLSCNDTFGPSPLTPGSYSLSSSGPVGLYTMTIPLVADTSASPPANASSGTINFGILVPSPDGKGGNVIETDSGSLTATICDNTVIKSIVLRGHLRQLQSGQHDD
jgi:hypothetical protein